MTVSAGAGNDRVFGGLGDDLSSGGPGDDLLDGGLGNDRLDGGSGDDALRGGLGADYLSGGEGSDRATGWLFERDACRAEVVSFCGATLNPSTISIDAAVLPQSDAEVDFRIRWTARSTAELRLIEIYAGTTLVSHRRIAGLSSTGIVTLDPKTLPSNPQISVTVTDATANQAQSSPIVIDSVPQRGPSPALTGIELRRPTSLTTVIAAIDDAGLVAEQYEFFDVPGRHAQLDPAVAAHIEATGIDGYLPDSSFFRLESHGSGPTRVTAASPDAAMTPMATFTTRSAIARRTIRPSTRAQSTNPTMELIRTATARISS